MSRAAAILMVAAMPLPAAATGTEQVRADRPGPAVFAGALGRTSRAGRLSIRPTAVVEDSRCPANANCIQAGTVRLRVAVSGPRRRRTVVLGLGSPAAVDGSWLHLVAVCPNRMAGVPVPSRAYRFNFALSPSARHVPRDAACT